MTSKKASMKMAMTRAKKSNMKLLLLEAKTTSLRKLQKSNHSRRKEMPAMLTMKNSIPVNMQQPQQLNLVSPAPKFRLAFVNLTTSASPTQDEVIENAMQSQYWAGYYRGYYDAMKNLNRSNEG